MEPFVVMATQNPIEQEGTLPALLEAQVDRFMLMIIGRLPDPRRASAQIVDRAIGPNESPRELRPLDAG